MKRFDLALGVGLFMIVGIACLGFLSVKLGRMEPLGGGGYMVHAVFSESGGLRTGAAVVIAGVEIGRVKSITLVDYQAFVLMNIEEDVKLQEDCIASIKTRGLIGEKYVDITPGAEEELIQPGGRIRETQPAIDLESLISKYVFGKI